ncbi:hypothetical protein DERP_012407 [Dermatophagoides pteronyssinus]|uniref:Titin-like n=1 Tax=Dermatophagoides pteronyssinus TaxID=6956 RepID=A0ABQ8IUZ8_DERPT|nr:hypothetical protein DERP_012407 [Dermatophagoides pteronyssinus]
MEKDNVEIVSGKNSRITGSDKTKKMIKICQLKKPDGREEIVEQITEVTDDQERKPMIIRKYRPESPKQNVITEGEIISEEITEISPTKTTEQEKVKKLTIKRQIRRPDGVDETVFLKDVQEEIAEIPKEESILPKEKLPEKLKKSEVTEKIAEQIDEIGSDKIDKRKTIKRQEPIKIPEEKIMLKEKPKPTTLVKISEEIIDVTGDIPKKIHKIRKFRKPKDSKMPELNEIKPEDIIEEIEEIKKIIVRKYRQRPEDKKPKLLEEEKILQEKIIEIPSEESEKWKKILFRRKLKPGTVETEFILEKNVMEEIAEVTSEEIVELPCQDRPEEPKKLIIRSTVKQPDGTVEIMERPADKSMIMESVDGKTKLKIIRRPVVQFDSDELFEFSMEKLEKMKKVVESKKPEEEEMQAISSEEMTEKPDESRDVIIQEELISEETTKEIKEPGKPKKMIITIRKVKRPDNEEEEIVEQITEVPDDQDRKPKTMIIRKYRPESPKQQQMITEEQEKVKKLTIKRQIRRPDGVDEIVVLNDVQEEIVEIPMEEIIEQPVKDKIRKKLIIKRRKSVETVDVIDEELIEPSGKEDSEDKKINLTKINTKIRWIGGTFR